MAVASSQIQDKETVNCEAKLVYNDEQSMKKCVECKLVVTSKQN